jgi:hypothetical protein
LTTPLAAALVEGMSTSQVRKPKGTPTGGQFAPKSHLESPVAVEPSWPGLTRKVETFRTIRVETWVDEAGRRQDPPDGSPAVRSFHPDGTVAYEEHWVGDVRQRPVDCVACGASVSQDNHGTWIDETGGDVCGVDGDNAPHRVGAASGSAPVGRV